MWLTGRHANAHAPTPDVSPNTAAARTVKTKVKVLLTGTARVGSVGRGGGGRCGAREGRALMQLRTCRAQEVGV